MKKSASSDLAICPTLEASLPADKLRQIIVPVDLTSDCTASIDDAISLNPDTVIKTTMAILEKEKG